MPCELDDANGFVARHHRHHGPVRGHKFSFAVLAGERICGVAIVGRPVSRVLDDGWTLEVTRCCTDGTPHAASALYGACRRATVALAYRRLVTYTLASEPGTSLRAAGWRKVSDVEGRSWSCASRPRIDRRYTLENKLRWEAAV